MVNNNENFVRESSHNNKWYAKINEYGEQVWARVNNGKIVGAGKNKIIRGFNDKTGFCNSGGTK